MIAEETGLDKNAVHRIITEHLHMRKMCARLVLKKLSVEQKANWSEICQDLLGRLEVEPDFLYKVLTGGESWVFDYDSETKQQSAEWHMKRKISSSEESTHEQFQDENYDYCFFRHLWHCAQRICTSRTDS
jgi:hypothetical protein